MAGKRSAGLLVFRAPGGALEVLLGHMGGPLWAAKDLGAWSIPKGEHGPDEAALDAARREYEEELGLAPPDGAMLELGEARQLSGKIVAVWAVEGDVDPASVRPGTFTMEWPPRTGVQQAFPEIDRVEWFDPDRAAEKLLAGQRPFLDRLVEVLARRG